MPKSYVDNAYNRSIGRVGMPVGSMVVSSGSSGGSHGGGSTCGSGGGSGYGGGSTYGSEGGGGYGGGGGFGSGAGGSYSSGSSGLNSGQKTYVDNAYNRQHDRVGLLHGSAVMSRSGAREASGNSSSQKTYVDNAYNRQHDRVGLPHGSAVMSRSGTSEASANSSSQKTYVDNAYNRQHDRVGLHHGSAIISKSRTPDASRDSGIGPSPKVYKDNPFNRSLGRVGKPLGACVFSRSSSAKGAKKEMQLYVDNSLNQRLGRVGKPRGCMPHSRVSKQTDNARRLHKKILDDSFDFDDLDDRYGEEFDETEMELAVSLINRRLEELKWQEQEGTRNVKTSSLVLEVYTGVRIDFAELELGKKIGQGGFGDVHFATWNGSVVAVKKLRVQRVSKRRLDDFAKEVMAFCDLEHPNIVKFIGACLKTPNLCIVMEYMQTSLFTALHMSDDDIEFTEEEKLSIIQQTSEGLRYLHHKRIAHCDLKSQNVLLDYETGETCIAKITDFGLSMVKSDSEISVSAMEQVRNIGTPRYSSPEVLRGEMMSAKAMMLADIYSFALVMFEVLYQEEPFYSLKNYAQLQKQVGKKGITPEIPDCPAVRYSIQKLMKECWDYNPKTRPDMEKVSQILNEQTDLYVEE